MDAYLPPWLEHPGVDATQLAIEGFKAGSSLGESIAHNRIAKQDLGQRAEQLKMDAQRYQVEEEATRQKMGLEIQDAQRKLKAQKGYEYWTQMGGDPVEGMMKFGPGMGESLTGLGTLANARRMQADIPSEVATTPEGTRIWKFGGRLYGFDKPTKADLPGALTDEQKVSAAAIQNQLKQVDTWFEKHPDPSDPIYGKLTGRMKAKQAELESQLKKLLPSMDGGEESDTGAGDDVVATYDPKTGTFKKSGE